MAPQQAWNHCVDYTALIGTEIYFISWVPGLKVCMHPLLPVAETLITHACSFGEE